jgi:hypothetical protein
MSQAAPATKSADPMVVKLSSFFEADLGSRSENFCIHSEELSSEEIAAPDGLLSLFLFKASTVCEEAFKKKLPLHFETDTSALIDVVPITEASELNLFSLWTHFLSYSVEEEIRRIKREKKMVNGMIPLDELYKQWHKAVTQQKYVVAPSSRPQPAASQTT